MNVFAIHVTNITDNPDGSATIMFDMGVEAMKVFAAIGLQQVLIENAKEIINGRTDAEGSGDAKAGTEGDTDFHEHFPGF